MQLILKDTIFFKWGKNTEGTVCWNLHLYELEIYIEILPAKMLKLELLHVKTIAVL